MELSDDDLILDPDTEADTASEENLYDGYTDEEASEGSATGKKKADPSAATRQEKRLSKVCCKSAKNLPLTSGEVHGDTPLPLEAKLLDCLPRVLVEGKQVMVC